MPADRSDGSAKERDQARRPGRKPIDWRTAIVQPDEHAPPGFRSLIPATWRGSTTLFRTAAELVDTWDQRDVPYTYGLYGTPTTLELAARICELEGGYATLVTPGGQSALALVYLAFLSAGDHVLIPESVYGPSRDFADSVLGRLGVAVTYYPPGAGAAVREYLRPETRLVWCESPGSITFEVQDVPAIAHVAHEIGALVAVDNTWSAGILFDALGHGADVTIQALTKYVGGHSDLLLGSVTAARSATYQRLGSTHAGLGMAVSPDDCYLAIRSLLTLGVRLQAIERGALSVASWLSRRPELELVLHPALATCPGHDVWKRDFKGSSGTFSIVFGPEFSTMEVESFVDGLRLFRIGYSWGGVTSLAIPGGRESTRADYAYDHRLVRLSIGLEDPNDLIADLSNSLASLARHPASG